MIDDDIKFFRQNFSASSLSDFHDTPQKHPLYQTKGNRLHVPKLKVIARENNHQREEERHYQKTDLTYVETKNISSSKASQFKILNKLKNEYEEIKHMHPQSQEQSLWMEQSDRASQPGRLKFKASKSQKKEQEEERVRRNSAAELKEERREKEKDREREREKERSKEREREKEIQEIKETNLLQLDRAKDLANKIQQKDRLIKKMRNAEDLIVEQYKSQIKHLKSEIDKLVDENTGLKREIISKDLESKELREGIEKKQWDLKVANLEREVQLIRNKEKEYLETIRSLQEKEEVPLPNIEMISEINQLKQALVVSNQEWEKRVEVALEAERAKHAEAIQRLESANFQIPPTPMSQMVNNHNSNFEDASNHQSSQFMRGSSPGMSPQSPQQIVYHQNNGYQNQSYPSPPNQNPSYSSHHSPYPNINIRAPEYQKDRGERVIQLLVSQLQQLRRPSNPIEDQLRNIKQSIRSLMKRPSELGGREYKDLAVTTDSLQMVSELQNLKMYIIKEENARKNYNEEVSYYRSQHTILSEENKSLKTQVTTLQESLDVSTLQNDEFSGIVMELRVRVEEKSRHIQQLASSLANIQNHQIDNYTKIKSNVDRERSHQLQTQVERLRALLQTEVIQLNKTHDQKNRSLQLHIHNLQRRIKEYQQLLHTTKQQLKQLQTQYLVLTDKSTKDITMLRQANQRLQQQNISYKGQLTSVATNNHQLQTQVKERTHVIDHLWMVKQAEFENIIGQLTRLREGYI